MVGIKAFFIDKDGTIVDNSNYPRVIPTDYLLYEDIISGLKLINRLGYKIFIISNQPWIAKSRMTSSEVDRIFENVISKLEIFDIPVEDYLFCPHQTTDLCDCKKPKTLMIDSLIQKYGIDRENSFIVGDMDCDILMGKNAGIKTILVRTGNGKEFEKTVLADFVIDNLNDVGCVLNG